MKARVLRQLNRPRVAVFTTVRVVALGAEKQTTRRLSKRSAFAATVVLIFRARVSTSRGLAAIA